MTKKIICALAVPLALAACSGRPGAEKAVRDKLNDPDSAKFGAFYSNAGTHRACLTFNAKNRMGGYVGDRQAHLVKEKGGWTWEDDEEEAPADCRAEYANKADGDGSLPNATDTPQ